MGCRTLSGEPWVEMPKASFFVKIGAMDAYSMNNE